MPRKRTLNRNDHPADDSLINLTPLIDVVFVVLIMFILVAPMLELDKIELAQGVTHRNKEKIAVQENSPITIHVRADDSILFQSKPINLDQLLPLLQEAKRKHPGRIPQLYQDKKGHFGTYQSVKNALESAGFEELDVVLQPG